MQTPSYKISFPSQTLKYLDLSPRLYLVFPGDNFFTGFDHCTMVDSPYSLTSNDINVLSEEGWGPVDVSNFQRDALAAQYPTPVMSADI